MLSTVPSGGSLSFVEEPKVVLPPPLEAGREQRSLRKTSLVAVAILVGSAVAGAFTVTCSFVIGTALVFLRGCGFRRAEALPPPRAPANPLPRVPADRAWEAAPQARLHDLWENFVQISAWLASPNTTDAQVARENYHCFAHPGDQRGEGSPERFTGYVARFSITAEEVPEFLRQHPEFQTLLLDNVHRILDAWEHGELLLLVRAGKMAKSLRLFMPPAPAAGEAPSALHTDFREAQARLQRIIRERGIELRLVGRPCLAWVQDAIFASPYHP